MTNQREESQGRDGPRVPTGVRRPYSAPELIDYGTVAKLTQTGTGSVSDFSGMMMMMFCL